jgi:hypothetical protein
MTALNKTIRQQIIDSVIEKGTTIPKRKEELKKKTEARVRKLDMERVPKEFAAATKNMPPEWFPLAGSASIKPEYCPIAIVTLQPEQLRNQWRSTVSYEPFRHPMNTDFNRANAKDCGINQATKEKNPDDLESWEARLEDLIAEANKIVADEAQARHELSQFLYSVNNYKQVIEKMPELEKHLPNYTKPMSLTVSVAPILKTLGKLGFDQLCG